MIPSVYTGSFIHSLIQQILSTYCKTGTVLGIGDKVMKIIFLAYGNFHSHLG